MRTLFLVLCLSVVMSMEDAMTNRVLNKFYGKRQQSVVNLGAVRQERRRAARQDNYQVALTQISGGSAEVARRLTGGTQVAPSLRTTDYARQTATATAIQGVPFVLSTAVGSPFFQNYFIDSALEREAEPIRRIFQSNTGYGSPAPTRTTTPKISIL